MNIYTGHFDNTVWYQVLLNDQPFDYMPSFNVAQISIGFSWGYEGAGVAQLALAILLQEGLSSKQAVNYYQDYKHQVLAKIPREQDWKLTSEDVQKWIDKYVKPEDLAFACPSCIIGSRLEEVMGGVTVRSNIIVSDDGHIDYREQSHEAGEVVCYGCVDCGYKLKDDHGYINNPEELVKWLKKNATEEL